MPEKLPTQELPFSMPATVDLKDPEFPVAASTLSLAHSGTLDSVVMAPIEFVFRYRLTEDDDGHPDGAEYWCDLELGEESFDYEIPARDFAEIAKIHKQLFEVLTQHGRQVLAAYYGALVDRDMDCEVPELESAEDISLSTRPSWASSSARTARSHQL